MESKKLYRDSRNGMISGVCSGLSIYFDIDVTIIRVAFVVLFILGTCSFWVYLILLCIAPNANTALKRCQMRGIEPSPENIEKYS